MKAAVDKLEELALQELKLQSQVGKKVRELKDELDWLHAFLGHADQRRRQEVNEYMDVWVRQTRDVAFDAEDLLDEYFAKGRLHCRGVRDLPSFLLRSASGLFVRHSICSHIEEMKKRLMDIKSKRDDHNLQNLPTTWDPPHRHYVEWSVHAL